MFADFLIFQTMLWDQVGELLDAFVNVITTASLHHVVRFSPASTLRLLGLICRDCATRMSVVDFGWERGVFAGLENLRYLCVMRRVAWRRDGRVNERLHTVRRAIPLIREAFVRSMMMAEAVGVDRLGREAA